MTIEAAMVVPIFVFGIAIFLYLFQYLFLQQQIQCALDQTAAYYAKNAYLYQELQVAYENETVEVTKLSEQIGLTDALSSAIFKEKVLSYLDDKIDRYPILKKGRRSINIQPQAEYLADGEVDLCAFYTCKIPVLFVPIQCFDTIQRSVAKNWTGQEDVCKYVEIEQEDPQESEDDHVYVAETGKKYHTHRDCSYLRLSVREILFEEVSEARNRQGGKYTLCERCGGNANLEPKSTVYITDLGSRYHTIYECSGIKRNVERILKSEVPAGMECCSRCQKRDQSAPALDGG